MLLMDSTSVPIGPRYKHARQGLGKRVDELHCPTAMPSFTGTVEQTLADILIKQLDGRRGPPNLAA